MSRLAAAFERARSDGRAAFIAYLMAGDPDLVSTEAFARAAEDGGADILELGVPFSDPIADGPDIQQASQRALRSETRPRDVLELAGRLRETTSIPLVLMTYVNPVLAMGLSAFAERAANAGVDGIILPDVSLEVSDDIRDSLDRYGLDHVQLVAPSTRPDRAAAIARASRGFLYVVARYGTTGIRSSLPTDLVARIRALHDLTGLPLGVGFGVSTRDQVRALAAGGADGVVVGSAIVRRIAENPSPVGLREFVADLVTGLSPRATTTYVPRDSNR